MTDPPQAAARDTSIAALLCGDKAVFLLLLSFSSLVIRNSTVEENTQGAGALLWLMNRVQC